VGIPGQQLSAYRWKSASGWAEGFFLSAMQRVGQALETWILVDKLFDEDENALLAVCGDFNADLDEVPVEAIRGDVENTGNADLIKRIMVPCERTIPETSRFSYLHRGKGRMIDHMLVSRALLAYYKGF
jgi:predicted extracellular nuclease